MVSLHDSRIVNYLTTTPANAFLLHDARSIGNKQLSSGSGRGEDEAELHAGIDRFANLRYSLDCVGISSLFRLSPSFSKGLRAISIVLID